MEEKERKIGVWVEIVKSISGYEFKGLTAWFNSMGCFKHQWTPDSFLKNFL